MILGKLQVRKKSFHHSVPYARECISVLLDDIEGSACFNLSLYGLIMAR